QGCPSGFTVAGIWESYHLGTEIEQRSMNYLGWFFGEGEEEQIEISGAFPKQIVDPHSASMAQRKREVWRKHSDARLPFPQRPSVVNLVRLRVHGSVATERKEPSRSEPNAI